MDGQLSEVGRITHMVLRKPQEAFVNQRHIDTQWHRLGYTEKPSYTEAVKEYNDFFTLLQRFNITIDFLPGDERLSLDSLYVRDATIVTPAGVVLCNMGKNERIYEPLINGEALKECGVSIVGKIHDPGRLEGGDVTWIDNTTVAVGRSYRTDDEGIHQLRSLLDANIDVITVPLPHYYGPDDVFHLMSIFSPIDHDLAVVYSPLMPIPFRESLCDRGIQLIDVPDSEFNTMGCNVLAVAPRQCVMVEGNPRTKQLLEDAGAEVWEMKGNEICRKGQGGPTCLTRPLVRE